MPHWNTPRPLVGVVSDTRQLGLHPSNVVGNKYITALIESAGVNPVMIPSLDSDVDFAGLLTRLDGLYITGSPSNLMPSNYGAAPIGGEVLRDQLRDRASLALIAAALDTDLPVFGVCRGCQELNVVMGGTLHQQVHDVPGMLDHREDKSQPLEIQYGPAHPVALTKGGVLAGFCETKNPIVNSVHGQAIDRLGDGLEIEATAPDGLVEGIRVAGTKFALGVQWHPEWRSTENAFSHALFQAFGVACGTEQ